MSIGLFTGKQHQPTEEEIQAAIASQLPVWQDLIQFIRENYPSDEDFTFLYGKRYGWARRFRVRGKLLTSLYPTAGGFTVQLNLDPAALEKTQRMALAKNAQEAIARANPYPEGKWVFIAVESAQDVQDVKQLLALRAETKKLKARLEDRHTGAD